VTVVGLSLAPGDQRVGSQTITQKQIEDLPGRRKSLLSFASLSAGVTRSLQSRHAVRSGGEKRSQYVTVEGGRDSSTTTPSTGVRALLRFNNLS